MGNGAPDALPCMRINVGHNAAIMTAKKGDLSNGKTERWESSTKSDQARARLVLAAEAQEDGGDAGDEDVDEDVGPQEDEEDEPD